MTNIISQQQKKYVPPVTRRHAQKNGRIFFVIVALIIVGYVLGIMTTLAFSSQSYAEPKTYTNEVVGHDDTLWAIAERHCDQSTNIQKFIHEIAETNKLDNNCSLTPGQTLLIPIAGSAKRN